jgi:hypothetical protein
MNYLPAVSKNMKVRLILEFLIKKYQCFGEAEAFILSREEKICVLIACLKMNMKILMGLVALPVPTWNP